METTITSGMPYDMPPELVLTDTDSAGTTPVRGLRGMTRRDLQPGIMKAIARGISKAKWWRIAWASPDITPEFAGGEQIDVTQLHIVWASPDIILEFANSEQIFDATQSRYLSHNRMRDRQIADRIIALY